jgi:hypothetical protein
VYYSATSQQRRSEQARSKSKIEIATTQFSRQETLTFYPEILSFDIIQNEVPVQGGTRIWKEEGWRWKNPSQISWQSAREYLLFQYDFQGKGKTIDLMDGYFAAQLINFCIIFASFTSFQEIYLDVSTIIWLQTKRAAGITRPNIASRKIILTRSKAATAVQESDYQGLSALSLSKFLAHCSLQLK